MLDPGEKAPEFTLPDQNGDPVSSSEFGKRVVLYFYPRADTSGCTVEAKGFRDEHDAFENAEAVVLGVSTDPVDDLAAFAEKYDLPFRLLADTDGTVAKAYESFDTVEIRGDEREIAVRNTYVVDPEGRIEAVYEGVSPTGHANEVLADLTGD